MKLAAVILAHFTSLLGHFATAMTEAPSFMAACLTVCRLDGFFVDAHETDNSDGFNREAEDSTLDFKPGV